MGDKSLEWQMENDAKHLVFTLARYKFVSKCFDKFPSVLEVGCGNRFGGQIVRQSVGNLRQVDIPEFDITRNVDPGNDGVFMLDVFEHISSAHEDATLLNLSLCAPVCIIGTPSLESQKYASPESARLHINCVSGEYLRDICKKNWKHVFMFGMSDEVVHTGFLPMSHYLLALCVHG